MITGGLIITGVSFALGEYHDFELSEISGQSLAALIYLIAIITIVGFTDFYWLLRVTTPSLGQYICLCKSCDSCDPRSIAAS
jgi:drug/metabolite transporter (DMT)-like permease